MRLQTFFLSAIYSFSQAFLGLFLHPYQTMQQLVEDKVFLWLSFLPTVIGLLTGLAWWIGLKTLFVIFPYIGIWVFSIIWMAIFFVLWQLLLLYLLIRFWIYLG